LLSRLAGVSNHKPNLRRKFAAGVTVIEKAIQMACNELKPIDQSYDKRFLTTFMRTISMAFAFEGDGALSLLQGIKVGGHFLGCPAAGFIDNFVSSLLGDSQDSILHGIQFVKLVFIHSRTCYDPHLCYRFIFNNKIELDIGVLCDFMDWLSGCIILAYRLLNYGSLHHTILPRTWLLSLSRIFVKLGDKKCVGVIESFLRIAQRLLERLDSITKDVYSHLIFKRKTLSQAAPIVAHTYIARL
jgi:hypothetical protein